MGTDIHGCIEIRDPHADEDWFEWEPWQRCMDLHPQLSEPVQAVVTSVSWVPDQAAAIRPPGWALAGLLIANGAEIG
ncbi:hypothetical protein [Kitasatospora sp. NPDC004272]